MAYFNNPLTKPQGFFSSQPGGLFGPPQQEGFAGFLSDPRVSIGMAIAQGQPIGQALLGGALQAKQIETAMFPQTERDIKIINNQAVDFTDPNNPVVLGNYGTEAKPSERELRLNDLMSTFKIDRETAIKYDKGLLEISTDEKGAPVLIDKVSKTQIPIETISSELNTSASISTTGEQEIANQFPEFFVDPPTIVEKAYGKSERDDATKLAGTIEIGLNSAKEVASIIESNPEFAGVVGALSRIGKSIQGALSDLATGVNLNLYDPFIIESLKNPKISQLAILEENIINAMADTATKKGDRTPPEQLRKSMRDKLGLTGFTDSASALTRLKEVAKKLNEDSQLYQGIKGGYNTELYGPKVKDYSLDKDYNILFNGISASGNIINITEEQLQELLN